MDDYQLIIEALDYAGDYMPNSVAQQAALNALERLRLYVDALESEIRYLEGIRGIRQAILADKPLSPEAQEWWEHCRARRINKGGFP